MPDTQTIGLTTHERDALHDLMVHPDPFDEQGKGFLLTDHEAYAISRILRRDDLRRDNERRELPVSHLRWAI